jgi:hypothetical protein
MTKYSEKLTKAIDTMLAGIKEYESDTFSASRSDMSQEEVESIAAGLILGRFFDESKCPGPSVDGILLDDILSDIRYEDEDLE